MLSSLDKPEILYIYYYICLQFKMSHFSSRVRLHYLNLKKSFYIKLISNFCTCKF